MLDVIAFTQELIQHWSVTPDDDGCLDVISKQLNSLGFRCHRSDNNGVANLYARLGEGYPNFCFLGHTDVVPPGNFSSWSVNPFEGVIRDGFLYGRGASDMKGAIAAFVGAVERFLACHTNKASISLLLTSDEEGPACFGTRAMVNWLQQRNEHIDACLVGEPTNPHYMGEMIKVGRRGILDGDITIIGKGGHVAYPEFAENPINILVEVCEKLKSTRLDHGYPDFQPSHLEITTIDVDNNAGNVIPEKATAHFNVRFNPNFSGETLRGRLEDLIATSIDGYTSKWQVNWHLGGEAFLTENSLLKEITKNAVELVTGIEPVFSTTGGTSDGRFVKDLCPVVEFGLLSNQAHKIDEHVHVNDITTLREVYCKILSTYCDKMC